MKKNSRKLSSSKNGFEEGSFGPNGRTPAFTNVGTRTEESQAAGPNDCVVRGEGTFAAYSTRTAGTSESASSICTTQ